MTVRTQLVLLAALLCTLGPAGARAESSPRLHSNGAPKATIKAVRMGAARLANTLKGYGYLAKLDTPAARKMIVHGAVTIVQMALQDLADKNVVQLDEERKASMVSNLLVVLCGEAEVHPVINTGTLYN